MQSILPYLVSALLYAVMAAYFWRLHWSPATQEMSPLRGVTERACVLASLTVHGLVLFGVIFADHTLRIGVGDAISAILWLTVLIYWLGSLFYRLEGLQALILPVAAVAAFLPALLPAAKPLPNTDMLAFKLHLVMSMAAYSLFTIASLHVLLMAMLERRLPPLLTMENLLFRIIWAGFIMLTLTLVSGVFFSEEVFGKAARLNHKSVFGFVSWFVFAALLLGRHFRGWRGRVAVRWTLAGFMLLVLAYLGSKFVLEILLGRV